MLRRETLKTIAAAALVIAMTGNARAEFPDHTIRMINSSSPGSTGDILARTVAKSMEKALGVPVTVEGKSDAMYEFVKSSAPDGYTLAAPTISMVMRPSLSSQANYTLDDFISVAHLGTFGSALAVNPSLGVKNLKELIELSQKQPLFYGFSGAVATVSIELIKQQTGLKAEPIPYDNANESVAAILSNEIQFTYTGVSNFAEHIKAGTLTGIFVAGTARHPLIPDVATLAEQGFPDLAPVEQWNGLYAPKGTPMEAVNKLHDAVVASFKDPEVIEQFKKLQVTTNDMSQPEFAAFVDKEFVKWRDVIRKGNLKQD